MASIRVRQALYEKWAEADLLALTTEDPVSADRYRYERGRYRYLMDEARRGVTDKEIMSALQNVPPLRLVARTVEV